MKAACASYRSLFIRACLVFVFSTTVVADGLSDKVQLRMKALEDQVKDYEQSIFGLIKSQATESNATSFRRQGGSCSLQLLPESVICTAEPLVETPSSSPESSMFIDNVHQILNNPSNTGYKICPAYRHQGACLHVGGDSSSSWWSRLDNGIDVRVYAEPSKAERIAMKKDTWDRSTWKFNANPNWKSGGGHFVTNIKSASELWLDRNLFIPDGGNPGAAVGSQAIWHFDQIDPDCVRECAERWDFNQNWQLIPGPNRVNGKTYWSFRLTDDSYSPGGYLHSGGVDWDVRSWSTDLNPGSWWTIEKLHGPRHEFPLQTSKTDFVRGRYFKICPVGSHLDKCLIAGNHAYEIAVYWPDPGADSELLAWPGVLWEIYNDWDDHYVLENVLYDGTLLHVDEGDGTLSVHPTAPNPGSRWHITPVRVQDGKQVYSIRPSQRHTAKSLFVGEASTNVFLSVRSSEWFIIPF